jgi:putative aldouronate transport system permease protein
MSSRQGGALAAPRSLDLHESGPMRRGLTVLRKDFSYYRYTYLMVIPVLAYYFVFHYGPMYGVIIAFKDFTPRAGILGSPWVGLKHLQTFWSSYYFWRLLRNTLLISLYNVAFGFPAPILLALLLNEVRIRGFKRAVQTLTYIPYFVSLIVICGIVVDFTASDGVINDVISALGGERRNLLADPNLFRAIHVTSEIWQHVGFNSIIYLAAISSISSELYEAAVMDGAGRLQQAWHITLPGIAPTAIILLILRLGRMMAVGYEKIILLYNPLTYETADVISSFVFRKGLLEFNFSYSTAVGFFNSIINLAMLVLANRLSRRFSETSLW